MVEYKIYVGYISHAVLSVTDIHNILSILFLSKHQTATVYS